MDADIAYFVTYPCPDCRLELEAEHDGWQGWLRCPACGTPSLPPEILLGHPATMRRVKDWPGTTTWSSRSTSTTRTAHDRHFGPRGPPRRSPSALVSSLRWSSSPGW